MVEITAELVNRVRKAFLAEALKIAGLDSGVPFYLLLDAPYVAAINEAIKDN